MSPVPVFRCHLLLFLSFFSIHFSNDALERGEPVPIRNTNMNQEVSYQIYLPLFCSIFFLSLLPIYLSTYVLAYLYTYLPTYLSIYLSAYLPSYLLTYLPICLLTRLLNCIFTKPATCLYFCLFNLCNFPLVGIDFIEVSSTQISI